MPIKLTKNQNEYIRNADKRWNFKVGAVRSGKSYVDMVYMIPYRLRTLKDKPGLNVILGVSKSTIERNVLNPMREVYGDSIATKINNENMAYVCDVPVYCLGAEKISQLSKILGASFKYCYGDEVAKWNREVFAMLQSRLDKDYSRFDGACNPESPGHWLKTFLDREDLDTYVQKYTLFDNPYLPEAFVKNLCKEYEGTVYYGRYVLGEWTLAEGLIYPMYQDAISEAPDDVPETYVVSVDYGTLNAFAAILWEKHDKVWYAVSEYYYSGRSEGESKTDEEYAIDLEIWLTGYFSSMVDEVGDPVGVPWPMPVIVDPSAASFIEALKRRRNPETATRMYKVTSGVNAVKDGIRETATAMKRGLIKFSPAMTNWRKEIQGYVWDDKAVEDTPIKVNDHAMDAMRYFVKTKQIVRKDDKRRNREMRSEYEDIQ